MKKIIALLMAAVSIFAVTACGGVKPEKDLENIKDEGKMVIGYTIYEPMNYKDENGKLTGFDTEFAEAVCKKLGVEAEFIVIDWENRLMELESGNIDCIWNGMTITDKIKAGADVTQAYAKNKQVVVMKKDKAEGIEKVEDLKGLKFAAESGSAGAGAVSDKGLDEGFVGVNAQTDALMEVKSGAVDACVIDVTMAEAMTGEGTDYADMTIALQLTDEEYGIACRKGSNLTAEINKIMNELKADGTLDKLADKYKKVELAF